VFIWKTFASLEELLKIRLKEKITIGSLHKRKRANTRRIFLSNDHDIFFILLNYEIVFTIA
jgi:hypothetical protein